MAGIFGIWSTGETLPKMGKVFEQQAQRLRFFENCRESCFSLPGKICLGKILPEKVPGVNNFVSADSQYTVFLQGRIYNLDKMLKEAGCDFTKTPEEKILLLYRQKGWDWLSMADGRFVVALYDRQEHALYLASDPLGFSPLYYMEQDGLFAFGCRLKAAAQTPWLFQRIDPEAVREYFTFGYLLEDRTWFKEVKLFPPGTVMKISPRGVEKRIYRDPHSLSTASSPVPQKEALHEISRLWEEAVISRLPEEPGTPGFGGLLSGGLDTRAILAAMPDDFHPVDLICYGDRDSDDHRLAALAAAVKNDRFHFREIHSDDWIERRAAPVYWTDGFLNLLHMHSAGLVDFYRENFSLLLDGFLGDVFLGGSYMTPRNSFDEVFRKMYLENPLGMEKTEAREYLKAVYEKNGLRDEIFLINQRGRRFILSGVSWLESFLEVRLPFTSIPLLNFACSLPPDRRRGSRLYNQFLLEKYPEYFQHIPWQKTGLPVGASRVKVGLKRRLNRLLDKFGHLLIPGHNPAQKRTFCDYSLWFGSETAQRTVLKTIFNADARWTELVNPDRGRELIKDFIENPAASPHLETVGLLLTLEMYLQGM